ncbi:MAG: LruC domain-containing protein, partial [Bacteroidota bacterium]|nr:LruC domain-containing protein [Bacteroidota bacterium]
DNSRFVKTKITIPTYINELRLIYNGANGPNMAFIANDVLEYSFNTKLKSVKSSDCDLSGFTTYSKGGWGQKAHGNNVGALRDQYFDQVYPNEFVIGDPNNYTITFDASINVKNYLPGGGSPKVLSKSWTNPKKKKKLGNMADQIIAARLNVDYNEAGFLGNNPDNKLGELVFLDGPFENMSVNDFLAMAEIALGDGGLNGYTVNEYKNAAENINMSFHEGNNTGILTCPNDDDDDDEPYIEISSICANPDGVFTIINSGEDDMDSSYDYRVYKNNTLISSGNYQLDINETLDITTTGGQSDVFKVEVETPRGETIFSELTDCGNGGNINEQLQGTLAYEDLWPGKGDYDFNDLIIDYDFEITKTTQEIVQSITATFKIKAFGASMHNGFGFTLPNVLPSNITSVTGCDIQNTTVFDMASNGVENGQSKATFIIFDDARRVMPQTTPGIGVNTQLQYDFIEPVTVTIVINFASNVITFSDLNIGDFNPFIIVNTLINGIPGERGKEIHLPNYEPSDLFNESLLGSFEDDSDASANRYFVTESNLPWAINIAEEFDWVIEFPDITDAYHNFAEWAESSGINYPDWYKDNTGYRNDDMIYPTQK